MTEEVTYQPMNQAAANRVPMTMRDHFFKDPHFAINWENFDKLKEHVMHVSHDLWKKINAHLHSHKPMLDQDTKDASDVATFPRHWMLPSFPGLMENADILDLYRDADKELIRYKEDEDGLELSLDTHLYQPDQLHITVENCLIIVTGKREERSEDGKRETTRQFRRVFTLPAWLTKEQVNSNLSADGILVITASKSNPPAIQ